MEARTALRLLIATPTVPWISPAPVCMCVWDRVRVCECVCSYVLVRVCVRVRASKCQSTQLLLAVALISEAQQAALGDRVRVGQGRRPKEVDVQVGKTFVPLVQPGGVRVHYADRKPLAQVCSAAKYACVCVMECDVMQRECTYVLFRISNLYYHRLRDCV